MAIDVSEIVELWKQRKESQALWLTRALEVRTVYNLEASVPLPELDRNEKVAVANLLAQGLDQQAMRIASTIPDVYTPPTKPGQKKAEAQAETRRKAMLGWWSQNAMKRKLRRRARWLIGYATAPVMIQPDFKREIPSWHLRDPLSTYPCPTQDPDEITPPDVIFSFSKPLSWLRERYPIPARTIYTGPNCHPDALFSLLEYSDAAERVLCVVGRTADPRWPPGPSEGSEPFAELERMENRTGLPLAVVPNRICLDRPQGQYDSMIGMYQQQAMLQALSVIAAKRSVFMDEWLEGRPNESPKIVVPANGLTGQVGVVEGGAIRTLPYVPGAQVPTYIDRLERYERVTAGIPPEFGGESGSNIRTGRRGDAVLAAAVDFAVQEAQEMLAESLQAENRVAISVARSYFGDVPKSFWVAWKGPKSQVDYVANDVFTTDECYVAYSHAGADVNSLVIGLGQRLGTGMMSVETAREIDPLIDDPAQENDRIVGEGLARALLTSLEQQATQGAIPPADLARITELVSQGKQDLFEAVTQAHDESQKRQAAQAPPGSPETQPGLGQPGQGAEQPSIPPPPQGLGNLSMLLQQLRRGQRAAPGEAGGEAALRGQAANA